MSDKIRAAIIGGSESGKTFLTHGFSRGLWRARKRSLVFDPWKGETKWGPQAWVTHDFEQWKRVVTGTQGCAVIWDESTANGGRDRENLPLFTEIRHRHPVLFCIGHAYSAMLPVMRGSLTDLFLANTYQSDADEWSQVMRDPEIARIAPTLAQYEFLHKRCFQPIRRLRYSPAQIMAGILP